MSAQPSLEIVADSQDDGSLVAMSNNESEIGNLGLQKVPAIREELRLLGLPSLQQHLDFVRRSVRLGSKMPRKPIIDAWRNANERYQSLEQNEATLADRIDALELDPAFYALAHETMASEAFRKAFDILPTGFAMVELDCLVACERKIDTSASKALQAAFDRHPDPEFLYRYCQELNAEAPAIQIERLSEARILASNTSHAMSANEAIWLEVDELRDGHILNRPGIDLLAGIPFGCDVNFFSAVRYGDRVLLKRGYDRAYAMRRLGITHAPCILEVATSLDEVEVAIGKTDVDDLGFYAESPRPPLFKDFFDQNIAESFDVYATKKAIEITLHCREIEIRA